MRRFTCLLVTALLLGPSLFLNAQDRARPQSPVKGHFLGVTSGYVTQIPPGKHLVLSGLSYGLRLGNIYSLFITVTAGPAFAREYDRPFLETRLFIENKFNILAQKKVQPVLMLGGHIGTIEYIYLNGPNVEHKHKFRSGFNMGAGVEIKFAGHWMTGVYSRFFFTIGSTGALDPYFHLQPMIAYRWY